MLDLINGLPDSVEVYLVGGAVRNALIKRYHGETWVQRDYDQAVTNNSSAYFEYLESLGFVKGGIDDPTHKTMAKAVIENAREISYEDNLVFDMHMVDGTTIQDNLRYSTGLSINGFTLSLRDALRDDWESKIISLPGALESIKNKQITINESGYTSESNYFFALLRFIGVGFSPPERKDVIKLFKTIADISHERYARNIVKLIKYVGGEERVREIVNSLGINGLDIFDEESTKLLAKSI